MEILVLCVLSEGVLSCSASKAGAVLVQSKMLLCTQGAALSLLLHLE